MISFKNIFSKKSSKKEEITFGERESDGFATVYLDGEPTHVRMFFFTEEQIEQIEKTKAQIAENENVSRNNQTSSS